MTLPILALVTFALIASSKKKRGNTQIPPTLPTLPPSQIEQPPPSQTLPPTNFPTPPTTAPPLTPTTGASFDIAANHALIAEGGYQDNYNDHGNWTGCKVGSGNLVGTNFGITACTYKGYFGKTPTVTDMQALTKANSLAIYKALFWDKIKGDFIQSQPLANIIFDGQLQHSINVKLLQETINNVGYTPRLSKDNKFGNKTLNAVNYFAAHNPSVLYNAYKNRRIQYYYYLVDKTPSLSVFLGGWLNRINSFNAYPPV